MKDFKNLRIWQLGFTLAVEINHLTRGFPTAERYGLAAQMNAAAVSIPSNIAEGNSRQSEKDKGRFIEIALGSCFELQTQILIADKLNYGDLLLRKKLIDDLDQEGRMLQCFLRGLDR